MTKQYIDKDALVAEIDRRIAENKKEIERASHKNLEDYFEGYEDALVLFKEKFLDTFEAKEVDLEKEAKLIANGMETNVNHKCKAFTSLEQSKKLAEILPLESADMYYPNRIDIKYKGVLPIEYKHKNPLLSQEIAAWSLAALLDIIPQEIFDGKYIINITEGIEYKWIITYDDYENRNNSFYGLSTGADNLIDACYEMIIKLNERKML